MRRFPDHATKEFAVFKKLNSPAKVQDFLDGLAINFEPHGDTCRSPLSVMRHKKAHCVEAAFLAAAIFWYHDKTPLLLDLQATNDDLDHVVALFRHGNRWGAVSKTNHAALRYRDPVYQTVRELAMSYFNEYFTDDGIKTLRAFSAPFSLLQYDAADWLTSQNNLWNIVDALDASPHVKILAHGKHYRLRRADPIEIKAGKLTEWRKRK